MLAQDAGAVQEAAVDQAVEPPVAAGVAGSAAARATGAYVQRAAAALPADALGGLLANAVRRRATAANPAGPVLARFAQTDPADTLVAELAAVGAAGSGVNGALWIEDAKGTKLWLKAEPAPTERQVFADKLLGAVGVRSTNTVKVDRPSARLLYEEAVTRGDAKAQKFAQERLKEINLDYHHLMRNVPGLSPAEAGEKVAEGGADAPKIQTDFVAAFRSESFANQLGRLFAADQFLGNADRISSVGTIDPLAPEWESFRTQLHPGNFKIGEDPGGFVLYAIDNDAGFESADRVIDRIEQAISGALLQSARPDTNRVFAAGVQLMFNEQEARWVLAKMLVSFRKLGDGELMEGFTKADALAFLGWAMDGWRKGQQLIMLHLPQLKREFEEANARLGGIKHTKMIAGFEEEDFRARKVFAQFAGSLPSLDQAKAKTKTYFAQKLAGGAGPYGVRLQQIFTPLLATDSIDLLWPKAEALSALAKDVRQCAKDEYEKAPSAANKVERLHLRQFISLFGPDQLDLAFSQFKLALAPPPAAAAVGTGGRRGHVTEAPSDTKARLERMQAAEFMALPLQDLKKAVEAAAKLVDTRRQGKAAEAAKSLPKYAHHT